MGARVAVVRWGTSAPMRSALLPLLFLLSACPSPTPPALELVPGSLELTVGETRPVELKTSAGRAVGATWTSTDNTVVRLSTNTDGLEVIEALAPGAVTVKARYQGATASLPVTVTVRPFKTSRLELSPPAPMVPKGLSLSLTATAIDADGRTQDVTASATWVSSDDTRATVSAGLVKGVSVGTVSVTATFEGVSAQTPLTITDAKVSTLSVSPGTLSLSGGTRGALQANAVLSDGTTRDVTASATWSSLLPDIATIDATGQVHALTKGVTTVTAEVMGFTATARVTVTDATLTGFEVQPATLSLARGVNGVLHALGHFSDNTVQDLSTQVTWTSSDDRRAPVTSAGVVTGLEHGQATVTASYASFTDTTAVTITGATVARLELTPAQRSVPVGVVTPLTATAIFTDTSVQDVTAQAVWSSSTPSVAQVTNAAGAQGQVTPLTPGTTTISATLMGVSASTALTVSTATVSQLVVTPAVTTLAKGLTQRFHVTGTFSDGTTADLTEVATWSVSAGSVASISNATGAHGLLSALAVGATDVIAQFGSEQGVTTLTVSAAEVTSIELLPATLSVPRGRTLQLSARATLTDGTTNDVSAQTVWTSSANGVATVSNVPAQLGLLFANAVGSATLTATWMSFSAQRTVSVTPAELDALAITPSALSLAKGRQQGLVATGTFSDGSTMDVTTQVTWASSLATSLAVSNGAGSKGVATALAVGSGTVSVTLSGITGSGSFTVTPAVITSLLITPSSATVPKGATQSFTATATLSDGSTRDVTTQVTWSSSNTTVATVSAAGVASTLLEGSTLISAQTGTVQTNTAFTVGPAVMSSLELAPPAVTLAKGETLALVATAVWTDGARQTVNTLGSWSTSAPAVVTVDALGNVATPAQGSARVTITVGALSANSDVTVGPARALSVSVSPSSVSLPKGRVQALSATAHFTDSSTLDVTNSATWSSAGAGVADVQAPGQVHGNAVGTTQVSATALGFTGASNFTVTPAVLDALALSGRTSLAVNTSAAWGLTGTLSDGSTQDFTSSASWSSATPAVAVAQPLMRGVLTAIAPGVSVITAQVGTASATASLKVRARNAPFAGRCAPGLVISQLFGGGGNTGAPFRSDYVELHNAGVTARSLNGLSLQYAPATGVTWANSVRALPNVTLEPGAFFLVQLNTNGSTTPVLTADYVLPTQLNISGTDGKVALVNGTTALSATACPDPMLTLDFVGYGGADCGEGLVAPAPSNTTALFRGAEACRDGNTNSLDFATAAPAPRTLASTTPQLCSCEVNETDLADELAYCNLQSPGSLMVAQSAVSSLVYGRVYEPGVTEPAGADASVTMELGFGTGSPSGWSWWPMRFNVQALNDDEYMGSFVAPAAGSVSFTTRVTRDGVNFTVCDLNGAGRNAGLTFDSAQLGSAVVTP